MKKLSNSELKSIIGGQNNTGDNETQPGVTVIYDQKTGQTTMEEDAPTPEEDNNVQ